MYTLIQQQVAWTDLHSELPQRADRDTRDRTIVVGRDDGALLGSTNTGHSLEDRVVHLTNMKTFTL